MRQEPIQFTSGKLTLTGTLVLPDGPGPFPTVILLSGSGPNSRWSPVWGAPLFLTMAVHLAHEGIAVLVYDKRGVDESQGDWRKATLHDLAADALAAVIWLRGRPEVQPDQVGLLGLSQGGWVAQIAAARMPDLAYLITMAGPGVSVREQILTDEANEIRLTGGTRWQSFMRVGLVRLATWALLRLSPVWRPHPLSYLIDYDPARDLARITCPVLALFGELDSLVPPAANMRRLSAHLPPGRVEMVVFPQANHLFWTATTGSRAEWPKLTKEFVPGFLACITQFIRSQ